MEKEENDGIVSITTTNISTPPPPHVPPSKKRSGWSLFRAALFTVRHHRQPDKKKAHIHANAPDSPAETHSIWRSLLCGMRPLHLQHLESCPSFLPQPQLVNHEFFHDTPLPPPSPGGSSDDGMSRYASAEDLQALDNSKDDGDDDQEKDATGKSRVSHSIDMRAEEFIASFYEQMRLQRLDSSNDQDD